MIYLVVTVFGKTLIAGLPVHRSVFALLRRQLIRHAVVVWRIAVRTRVVMWRWRRSNVVGRIWSVLRRRRHHGRIVGCWRRLIERRYHLRWRRRIVVVVHVVSRLRGRRRCGCLWRRRIVCVLRRLIFGYVWRRLIDYRRLRGRHWRRSCLRRRHG